MKCISIKRIVKLIFVMTLTLFIISCSKETEVQTETTTKDIFNLEKNVNRRGMAVVYFSINDDVEEVANKFKNAVDADFIKLEAAVPYSEEDLNFEDENSRVYLEDEFNPFEEEGPVDDDDYGASQGIILETTVKAVEKDKITELPKIKANSANSYPIIILGFPVWYENAPKVVFTFMKGLKNKIVVPFCVGANMGQIDQYLSNISDSSVQVMSGKGFDKDVTEEELRKWITELSADFN